MSEYKRLTTMKPSDVDDDFCDKVDCPVIFSERYGCKTTDCDNCLYNKILTRLRELENAIESGELVRLPYVNKISDECYQIIYRVGKGMMVQDFVSNEAQAEAKLKELDGKK